MSDEPSLAQTLQAKHDSEEVAAAAVPPAEVPTEQVQEQKEEQEQEASSQTHQNGKKKAAMDLTSMESFPTLGKRSSASNSPSLGVSSNTSAWESPVVAPSSPALDGIKSSTSTSMLSLPTTPQQKQDRHLIPELMARVQKLGVTVDSSTSRIAGTTTFIIKGAPEKVERAKRDIKKELSVKTTKTIQVPASVRASIIGSKGSTLKPIIEKSGCNIQVSRNEAGQQQQQQLDEDEEELVDVIIDGDLEGIQLATNEIMAIVKSKARDLTSKLQVEERIKPFVQQEFQSVAGLKLTVPKDEPLVLSGERTLVLEQKAKIDEFAKAAAFNYAAVSVPIAKSKQHFLDAQECFDQTGVAVFLDQDVTIFGPPNKLKDAQELLSKKAESLKVMTLDIARAHDRNIEHAENLALYFGQNKLNIDDVLVKIPTSFTGQDVVFEIVGTSEEKIKQAKKQVVGLVNQLPPSHVKRVADIDDFFRPHVKQLAKKIQSEHGVQAVMTRPIVLVYNVKQLEDDDDDDFAPGSAEIQQTLQKANAELDEIRSKQGDITSKTLTIPADDHKYINGPNKTTLNALVGQNMVTVELGFGGAKDAVFIRGLKSEVDRIAGEIDQVIHEGKNYEELSKYTTEFQFPVEHVNKLIGKQGANLAKIRDEFGVKIDVDEHGHGVVKGIKKNADEAKSRIIAQGKRMADEVVERLDIANDRHRLLIGQGGKFVKRLEDRYDVRIRFPRVNSDGNSNSQDRDAPRHKDEVVLRGPSRGVAKVKDELMDLLKYEEEHSYTETIKVAGKALPRVIGKQGEFINQVKDNTDTKIDVAHAESDKDNGDKPVPITIVGTKQGVKEAVESIMAVAKEISDTVTEIVEVDPKYHKLLIGPGGSNMREIVSKACGDDASANQRMIFVPRAGTNDSNVTVTGNKKHVQKVIKRINEIVDEQKSQVEILVDVAPERHGALIGPGGVVKRDIEEGCKVAIFVPQQNSGKRNIKVVGKQDAVNLAKTRIEELTASTFKCEVLVPRQLHSDLSDHGAFFRKLRNDYNVRVDHGREKLPTSASTKPPSDAIGEVLITDDEDEAANKFKWTVVEDDEKAQESSKKTIPWRLKGDDENCQKAKLAIEEALKNIESHDSTGYLWLADPTKYRMVIGSGGSRINTIREKSGCSIMVPKTGKSLNETIVVRGGKKGLETAKDMILQSVQQK